MLYTNNRRKFIDVCQKQFGRKEITSPVAEITKDNIAGVLGKALSIHWQNREEIEYLDNYYRGDQPINYRTKLVRPEINNKIVENHAFEIVEFMTAQNFGEPIQYVSRKKDEKISAMIDKLNDYMFSEDKAYHDVEIGRWRSICGVGYRFIWPDKNANLEMDEAPFSMDHLDPKDTFVIKSSNFGKRPLMSVQQVKTPDNQNMYCCYTKNKYFEVTNGSVKEYGNVLGGIPVIEYPNNARYLSDIEIVINLLDMINNMQSNRMDGIEQFVQSFMKFVNCDIDKNTFLEMCQIGALKVKAPQGVRADVDMVSSQLDQQQTQISKDDVYKNMLIVEGMPSREQNTGGDTGQAVYLRNGWDFAEQRAELGEPTIEKSEKESLKIILNILRIKQESGIDLKPSDVDTKITRSKTDNMLVKVQALVQMITAGIDPHIAITTCGLWSDPEKVSVQSVDGINAILSAKNTKDLTNQSTKGGVNNAK